MSIIKKCPVCGKEKKQIQLSDFDCEYCGFNNAFIDLFLSEKTYNTWKDSVKFAIQKLICKKRVNITDFRCLRVGNGMVAFLDLEESKIYIVLSNGKIQIENDAVEFDSSERNYAIKYKNGTVKVFGSDNEFGQKNSEKWVDIHHVLTAPNCTYGVTKEGKIVYAGSPADYGVLKWSNIRDLKAYADCLIGIRNNGSIVFSENVPKDEVINKASTWQNIKDMVMFSDSIVGLKNDGTILFLGKNTDTKRNCMTWKDIIAIEADNTYIYGLSRNGNLFVAGNCKKILDKGRKDAATWKNVMIISCNKAGIGAVNEKGDFLFAGTFAGDKVKIVETCNEYSDILIQNVWKTNNN